MFTKIRFCLHKSLSEVFSSAGLELFAYLKKKAMKGKGARALRNGLLFVSAQVKHLMTEAGMALNAIWE